MSEIFTYTKKDTFILEFCPYHRIYNKSKWTCHIGGGHCVECPYFIKKNVILQQIICKYKDSTPDPNANQA